MIRSRHLRVAEARSSSVTGAPSTSSGAATTPAAGAGSCARRTGSCRSARWATASARISAHQPAPATPTSGSAAPGSPGVPRSPAHRRTRYAPAGQQERQPDLDVERPAGHDQRQVGRHLGRDHARARGREPEQQDDRADERPAERARMRRTDGTSSRIIGRSRGTQRRRGSLVARDPRGTPRSWRYRSW